MLRLLRRRFASSISLLESEEDFLYANWLRVPHTEEESIGKISSQLIDTSFITYKIKQPFFIEHFFSFGDSSVYPEDHSYIFQKIGTNPVFFQLLYVPSRVINHKDIDFNLPANSYREIDYKLISPAEQEIAVQFKSKKPKGYLVQLPPPKIEDHLQNLQPRVLKFDLLNQNDFVKDGDQTLVEEVELNNFGDFRIENFMVDPLPKRTKLYKVKVPGMGNYKSKVFNVKIPDKSSVSINNFSNVNPAENSIKTAGYKFSFIKTKTKSLPTDLNSLTNSETIKDRFNNKSSDNSIINQILKKSFKVDWKSRKDSNINLSKIEYDNAGFLAENNRALLAVEPGLNKTKTTIAALQFLISNGMLSKILIIAPEYFVGSTSNDQTSAIFSEWLANIEKHLPTISVTNIIGDKKERLLCWEKKSNIHIIDHNTFITDINENLIDLKVFYRFDCVIMDEIQEIGEEFDVLNSLNNINPQVLWMLSSQLRGDLPLKLSSVFDEECSSEQTKFNRISDSSSNKEEFEYQEFWLEQDELQKAQYKETFTNCRKELKRILESGNPLRYQANIFMLLHKISQVQNFSSNSNTSPKSNLLLHHVKSIKENGRQVIIVSQYDQQGIKKIERLLDEADINYLSVSTGYSNDQIQRSISLFKTRKDVVAFLINDKVPRINFDNYYVPYLINFDAWWNPDLVYRSCNRFNFKDDKSAKGPLYIFSYKMIDTVDAQIKELLSQKELYNDSIVKFMSTNLMNDLISVEEWVKIFGLPIEDNQQEHRKHYNDTYNWLNNASVADLKDIISTLFSALGYSNIKFRDYEDDSSFDITGQTDSERKANLLHCRFISGELISIEKINQFLAERKPNSKVNSFIITNGKFDNNCYGTTSKNLNLIDLEKLVKYLLVLKAVHLPVSEST